jgi:hypothetical protein
MTLSLEQFACASPIGSPFDRLGTNGALTLSKKAVRGETRNIDVELRSECLCTMRHKNLFYRGGTQMNCPRPVAWPSFETKQPLQRAGEPSDGRFGGEYPREGGLGQL